MKKLFLIIPLLTISIDTLASQCASSLLAKLQLTSYIYQVINSDMSEVHKLQKLQKLMGIQVEGWHRSYPEGQTYKKHTLVIGKIMDIRVEDSDKGLYKMIVFSEEDGPQQFLFSGSYSPAFFVLGTTSIPNIKASKRNQLFDDISYAQRSTTSPFDLLSIDLDAHPEVAEYKERLRKQKAVVFYSQEHPFSEFSDSYEAPIVIDRKIWLSSGGYFQAKEFMSFNNPNTEHVMNIQLDNSLAETIRIGRDRSLPPDSDWEEVKNEVIFKALAAKFTQHKHLYDLLMSTGDALIVEHSERDLYWSDGESGGGKSMLGNLLMRLRDQLREGIMPGHEKSIKEFLNDLLSDIQSLGSQDTSHLAGQIASSNLSDIEKIDRIQMILNSKHFFTKRTTEHNHHTSSSEWITFINAKYPDATDEDFRYQLVKAGVSLAGSGVIVTNLDELNISHNKKIEIYRIMAGQSADDFIGKLPYLNLSHSEIKQLYLHSLQFEASTNVITGFPREVVNDAFIQEVISTLNKHHFPTQKYLSMEVRRQWRGKAIKDLIQAAAFHGLNYSAIYAFDNTPFNEHSERNRWIEPDLYPEMSQDLIRLILSNN